MNIVFDHQFIRDAIPNIPTSKKYEYFFLKGYNGCHLHG